jgi:hypothetical protein
VSASRSDWVLDQLGRLAAVGGPRTTLTMIVGNAVISGTLSSAEDFGRRLDERLSVSGGDKAVTEEIERLVGGEHSIEAQARRARERLQELRSEQDQAGAALPEELEREALAWEAPLLVLTLVDATIARPYPDGPLAVEMLRVRASAVAAWWLGSAPAAAPAVAADADAAWIEGFQLPRRGQEQALRRHLLEVADRYGALRAERDSLRTQVSRLENELALQRAAVGEALIAATREAERIAAEAKRRAGR